MVSREKLLVGYQLVRKINAGSCLLHDSACHLSGGLPWEGLGEEQDITRVKGYTEADCVGIDLEVKTRLGEFLRWYEDQDLINDGLRHFSIEREALNEDQEEIVFHSSNVRTVNALVNARAELRPHGDLLKLHEERIQLTVHPEVHIPQDHGRITTLQNLANAISYELRGICSYRGEETYKTVEARKAVVRARLRTAARFVQATTNARELSWIARALNRVERELADIGSLDDMNALSNYLDSRVAQLPILFRWWSYGPN